MFALAVLLIGLPEGAFAHEGHQFRLASQMVVQNDLAAANATTADATRSAHARNSPVAKVCTSEAPSGRIHAVTTAMSTNAPAPPAGTCGGGCCCCQGAASCGSGHCFAQAAVSGVPLHLSRIGTRGPRLSERIPSVAPIYGLDRPPKA
jgi:hypothetical protein